MKYPLIQVLLVTEQGETYLPDLLHSLERQTYPNWQLVVVDNASEDNTQGILKAWQAAHPQLLKTLILGSQAQLKSQSLNELVACSHADYLMLCDQDDVWFPEKIELQFAAMQVLEKDENQSQPLLVHSDLVITDKEKNILSPSLWEVLGVDNTQRPEAYLLNNPTMACATLFNRVAAKVSFPMPTHLSAADRWLALVCAWFGSVDALPHPTILYRLTQVERLQTNQTLQQRVELWSQYAQAFLSQFGERLDAEAFQLVSAVADLKHLKGWQRRKHIMQHRLFDRGVMGNVALLLFA